MKNKYLVVFVVILILVLGFFGRHKIKSLISGPSTPSSTPTTPAAEIITPSPMQAASASSMVKNDVVITNTDSSKGNFLTDLKGMTLYIFDNDSKDKSNCSGGCLTKWPAYTTNSQANDLPVNITTFKRAEGTTQYSWKGMPLYYYISDIKPGDLIGDGVGGIWHIVKP